MEEIPLQGGNMTAGVVRVGDTVRRPLAPQSPTIHRLLRHLEAHGVTWVPRFHGIDEQGREILDYIKGEVRHDTPDWMREASVLEQVMRALRAFHDATVTFERHPDDVWFWGVREPAEVIGAIDFAPYNHVFRDGRFAGAIDLDLCSPVPRLWDLAWTLYRYVPLTPPADAAVDDGDAPDRSPFDVATMRERARLALEAYGPYVGADGGAERVRTVGELLAATVSRLDAIADWGAASDSPEQHVWARMYRAHARWIEAGGLGGLEILTTPQDIA